MLASLVCVDRPEDSKFSFLTFAGFEVIFQVRVGVLPPITRYRETS